VFLLSAILGALANGLLVWDGHELAGMLALRFLTGFFLAGVYPVGMKIASDHFGRDLGKSLGFLVGALVVGTALPHLLRAVPGALPWKLIILATSAFAILGGTLVAWRIPDGPHRVAAPRPDLGAFYKVFRSRPLRTAALGYFGHMWEVYTFWAFVPVMIGTYMHLHPDARLNVPGLSFLAIGIGGPACVAGGFLATRWGARHIASLALMISCACCLISPLFFLQPAPILFAGFLLLWGLTVVPDSPLFSTLVAQHAADIAKGTALTVVTSIGFAVTIISIQLTTAFQDKIAPGWLYLVMAPGPLLGLLALRRRAD
jgi:MFS family permease